MKIQLIHPPVYLNLKAWTALRPAPPLGFAYVAGALENAGHCVSVIDALAEAPEQTIREGRVMRLGLTVEQILARIVPDAEVVGVTNMWSYSWPVIRELLREIKAARPDVVLICGGEHFSGLPELSMEQAPIDYIVRGEGEEAIVELVAALERGDLEPSKIAGLVWRDGEKIVRNPPRARVEAIDSIPLPAWHLFDLDSYNEHGLKTGIDYGKMVPIIATRGCPYSCTYCSSPRMWTTKWLARDPVLVADEIEHWAKTYDANNFPFQDLTVVIKRDWIIAFCKEIIRRRLDIRWQLPSGTRCEVIDEEVADLLYRSGCRALAYAPESGSDEVRKRIKKRMKREGLMEAVDAAVKSGLHLTCFIVLGFPHDSEAEIRENIAFVRELARRGVEDLACGFFFPIPSTELFDYLMEKKRIELTDDFLLTPILSHDRYLTEDRNYSEHLSAKRLTMYRLLLLLNFYTVSFLMRPRRIWRTLVNLVRGREESKLDSFIRIYVANAGRKLRKVLPARRPVPG
ncbi:MAG: B12-binding domain-containing radical SAM protein, partial [Candidatus Binatia bacterium]